MQKIDPNLHVVGEYFEKRYLGKEWSQPLFPMRVWNVTCRLNNGIPRTSNLIEGWHNRFQLGCHRPPIWRFLLEIMKEQIRSENTYARLQVGKFPRHANKAGYHPKFTLEKYIQRLPQHFYTCIP